MVNFKPTDEQELIRETMAGFAREVLRPAAREADEKNAVPETVVQRGWELGLVQSPIPEALGGYGDARSAVTSALLLEELAYGDLALTLHLLAPRLLTIPLLVAGTEEQRRRWLPRFAGAALAVGVARAAFDYARDYAKERRAFGVAIAQKQAVAFKLADMAIEIDSMRLLTWEAAWKLDSGQPATREAVLVKQYASQSALNITDNAVQVLGGHGYIREHPVELWLRNARGFATFDGLAIV